MAIVRSPARAVVLTVVACAACSGGTRSSGSDLEAYIGAIRAIDDHAHPMRPVPAGAPADSEFDALPLDGIPAFPIPWRLTPSNGEWNEVARTLYGVAEGDTGSEAIASARRRVVEEQGMQFATWALDAIGTDIMLANRISMGEGLAPPRFRWVAFADPLLFPLDTRAEAARTPDTRGLFPKEDALLRRYLSGLGLAAVPRSLDAYVTNVVHATLRIERDLGAVAVKFEAAYLRPLDFAAPDSASARHIYARYAAGGAPSVVDYRVVEDYLFREIVREAGRLGMAVQIHVFDGFGGFYDSEGSQPGLLSSVFDDPTLRETHFVIVHGGWPHIAQTESMIARPNVWADISMMDLVLEPSRLALVLRQWLPRWPDKVMFGSDAFEGGPDQSWAEVAAFSSRSARRALLLALEGMLTDQEITPERARDLASMVLRDNAIAAYRLGMQ